MSDSTPIRRISARKYRGLGDVVHAIAQPVARVIDRLAGTDIQHCKGCAARREKLNHITLTNATNLHLIPTQKNRAPWT